MIQRLLDVISPPSYEEKKRRYFEAQKGVRPYGETFTPYGETFTERDYDNMMREDTLSETEKAKRERIKRAFFADVISGSTLRGYVRTLLVCRECGQAFDIGFYCLDTENLFEHVEECHADVSVEDRMQKTAKGILAPVIFPIWPLITQQ